MLRNHSKDSMKSTWRRQARSEWTFFHWCYEILGIHPENLDKSVPIHSKDDTIPHVPGWSVHRWVLTHSVIPLLLHHAYVMITGRNLSAWGALILYSFSYNTTTIHQIHVIRRLGHIHGFLDGDKHARDGIPDIAVGRIFRSFISVMLFREMFAIFIAYSETITPSSMSFAWLPLEVGLYGIILDFWFYWYHRLMHDIDGLWKYHRTHHLTKHPNPLMAAYADTVQGFFDGLGIPVMTYFTMRVMGMPMGFYEWWVCNQYLIFGEIGGHSGLRVHCATPSTMSWVLGIFNAELVLEDHDLHHRKGSKKSYNYGKQTRLWDRIFGTCAERIESAEPNVDYVNLSPIPLY